MNAAAPSPAAVPDYALEALPLRRELQELRRAIHADPELELHLPRTQRRVLDALEGLDLEITRGTALSSVVAVLRGGRPGPVVLLRGDMDALPVEEAENGLEFRSATGAMHACGHDLHTAGLVGAARLLSAHREELPGSVIFMFQPGEENPGGARLMIEEGVLDAAGQRPVAAYGLHVLPGPRGTFQVRPGPALSGSNRLEVTFHGAGGHGSMPQKSVDPVPPLVEFASALQVMITRRFSVFDPVVASVTRLQAGEAINVIPDAASMGATVRTFSPEATELFGTEAARLAERIAEAHGARAEVRWSVNYPVTRNDETEAAFALGELRGLAGDDMVEVPAEPLMGSEDFSYVLNEVPGAFVLLLATPPAIDPSTAAMNHSPHVQFDDEVLPIQAAALARLAHARLLQG